MNAYLVKRRRRDSKGKLSVSRFWSISYKLDGETKYRLHPLHVRDKLVAGQLLAEFVKEHEQTAAGVIPPKALRDGAQKPLADHLGDFVGDLKAKGRATKYVYNTRKLVGKLLKECQWTYPKEITPDGFMTWRSSQTMAPKTMNEYLNHCNAFLNWMRRQGRLLANPLLSVGKAQTQGKESRLIRALSDDEVGRLLAVASPYKAVYLAAVLTGLRRSELQSLRWGDVHLKAPEPFLSVRASTTKNAKPATMFLRDDLAAELLAIWPGDDLRGQSVFKRLPSMVEFRADMDQARIAHEEDAEGRVVVFHSLRHTLATNLSRAGVSPRVAMEMMRHSDMRLTMKTYTDAVMLPMVDAMERLPRYEPVEQLAATGTDGAEWTEKGTETGVQSGQGLSSVVQSGALPDSGQVSERAAVAVDLSSVVQPGQGKGKSSAGRTRTYNIPVNSRMLYH